MNNLYNINSGYLELIFGPMFSGKTTKLIELYKDKREKYGKDKCLAINYAMDKRYSEDPKIVSHDNISIDCYSIYDLSDFIENETKHSILLNSDYIFINEAQFFPNLLEQILFIKNKLNKHVILCGLDLDFKREKFGELMDLVPYSNKVYKLTGKCNTKKCYNPSEFSHRIIEFDNQLLIGNDCYIPLCKNCYENINNNNDEYNLNY